MLDVELYPTPALLSPLLMVSTSPDTLMSSTLMSIREPLIATTSYELGIIVKSIDVSLFTVEVNLMASIETFPLV